jgi:hypothetical protein
MSRAAAAAAVYNSAPFFIFLGGYYNGEREDMPGILNSTGIIRANRTPGSHATWGLFLLKQATAA